MQNANQDHSSTGFYRTDIDGMRALAVCLVLAAHLHLPHLAGGFVGVDVFFVISGYLISSILLRELNGDRFSIVNFYERRIRRIVPALTVMLVFTSVVEWCRVLPKDLLSFGRSLIAAMFSFSNVYFANQSGYFDLLAERSPLLHTWSLGVEEQFYIVFPLLLLVLFRYRRSWLSGAVFSLALISFIACAVLVYVYPTQVFYLAPTRAWELLVGTMLAMRKIPAPDSKHLRHGAGIVGILLILFATAAFGNGLHYPGLRALLPVGGAALIILSGDQRDGMTYRLLSLKPVVFIGAISYSLYLWHWPLIALRSDNFHEPLTLGVAGTKKLIILESFVMGTLSWWLIERPFRRGSGFTRGAIFSYAAVAAVAVAAFGFLLNQTQGATFRYKPESVRIASYEQPGGDHTAYRVNHCFVLPRMGSSFLRDFDPAMCLPQSKEKPTILIVGNSHAAHLWLGLSTMFPEINWQQMTAVACLPDDDEKKESRSCQEMRRFLLDTYLPAHPVNAVLLSSNWETESSNAVGPLLDDLHRLHEKVILMGPVMRYDRPLPDLLVDRTEHGSNSEEPLSADQDRSLPDIEAILRDAAQKHPDVTYLSLVDLLCPQGQCVVYAPGHIPLQADDSHFTRDGSIFVAQTLKASGALVSALGK